MILNYKEFISEGETAPAPSCPVFFLHGLLGSADNWTSACRKLAAGGLRCIAVDQRNHGSSPHCGKMDYPLMAGDLLRLADSLEIEQFSLVGHSMGGKTAMETALRYPDRVKFLAVADIAPVEYEPEYREYIDALKRVDLRGIRRRSEAGERLEDYIPDRSLRMFFLTNLRRDDDGFYRWRINIEGIIAEYGNIWKAVEAGRVFKGPVLFLKGGESGFIREQHLSLISTLFPSYRLETVENAGHWLHVDRPDEVRRLLAEFLSG